MLDMLLANLGTSYIYHNALVALGPFLWGEDHGMKFSHIYSSQRLYTIALLGATGDM